MVFFSVGMEEAIAIMTDLQDPRAILFLKYIQAVTSFGLFIVSSFIIAIFLEYNVSGFLFLNRRPGNFSLLLVVVMIIAVLPFSNLMTELNRQLSLPDFLSGVQRFIEEKEIQMEGIMRSFLNVDGTWALMLNLLIIAVIPAIGEELLFRGVFQRLFISLTKSPHAGIFIAAFVFSALHLQFLSFLPRFVLGMLFGYLVYWSSSLWPAILAHFINNSLAVIYYHFHYAGKTEIDLENIGSPGHALYLGVISMVITAGLLYGIYKTMKEKDVLS
jgi:membrane protease YdiL (CAAX protease family)